MSSDLPRRRSVRGRFLGPDPPPIVLSLAISSDEADTPALTKKEIRPKTLGKVPPRRPGPRALTLVEDGDSVGDRVGDFLDRGGARLLQVVAADVDRVRFRDLVDGEGDHVGDQAHRRLWWEGVGAAGEVLLDDVVLGTPSPEPDPLDGSPEQRRRGRASRQRPR